MTDIQIQFVLRILTNKGYCKEQDKIFLDPEYLNTGAQMKDSCYGWCEIHCPFPWAGRPECIHSKVMKDIVPFMEKHKLDLLEEMI